MISACGLRNMNQEPLCWGETEPGNVPVAVGYDLAEAYPVGTVFSYDLCQCEVTAVPEKDSVWFGDPGSAGSGEPFIDLNQAVVLNYESDFNYRILTDAEILTQQFFVFLNEDADRQETLNRIYELADSLNINLYDITDLETQYKYRMQAYMEYKEESLILPLLMMLAAVAVSVITSYMAVYSGKNDYRIMLANGMLRTDI